MFKIWSCSFQVLITTARKIILYDWMADQETLIHADQGPYYGAFQGSNRINLRDNKCSPQVIVYTRSQDLNGNDIETGDKILKIDMSLEAVTEKHELSFSSFTHDMIRYNDHVFIADTGHGIVWQLSLPAYEISYKIDVFKPEVSF